MSDLSLKLVILAGGLGTRISEESDHRPKPMVELDGKPILVHIMEHYSKYGITEFVICAGYKAYQIKEYFLNFNQHNSDFTIDLNNGSVRLDKPSNRNWKISIVDTGLETMTGGRLRRVASLLGDTFLMTYGDGLSDVNIERELQFHRDHGLKATVVAVRPPSRFAVLEINDDQSVSSFREKPEDEVGWINGGFFILENSVLELIEGDFTIWEHGPLEKLARSGQLRAYKHEGFWHAMDTLRDKRYLEKLIETGVAPWMQSQ